MLIVRAPFRISLAGGGSDMPSYYLENDYGTVVNLTIDKYIYIFFHKHLSNTFRLKYSKTEDVSKIEDLNHDIAKACIKLFYKDTELNGYEIASIADVSSGSGLGSSSAYAVALIKALACVNGEYLTKEEIAHLACIVEIDILGKPIGKQDQYASSIGGINFITFRKEGVNVHRIHTKDKELENNLLLFHLGNSRSADFILNDQLKNKNKNKDLIRELVVLAEYTRACLSTYKIDEIGYILDASWNIKKKLSNKISGTYVNDMYDSGITLGATGGKLCGAGGTGFLLFYCKPEYQENLRNKIGLKELDFKFSYSGVEVLFE